MYVEETGDNPDPSGSGDAGLRTDDESEGPALFMLLLLLLTVVVQRDWGLQGGRTDLNDLLTADLSREKI